MALVTKIREKSGLAIGIIAVSLILFIVGGDLIGSGGGLFGGNNQKVGEIAGNTILVQDFQRKVDEARVGYEAQTGRAANEQELQLIREQAWNQFILEYAYEKEFEALGLTVTPEESNDMFFGKYVHPAVRQQFTNPQTGQFDKSIIGQYRSNLPKMPAEQQLQWQNFVRSVQNDRLRTKYESLMRLSTYTTTAEARREYEAQTAKVSLKYLFVPFYAIPDSSVKVTDAQLDDYLSKHRDQYKGANTRSIQYVAFGVAPSGRDSLEFKNQLTQLAKGLAGAANDSSFARSNTDTPSPLYWSAQDLTPQLKDAVGGFFKGQIVGPFQEGSTYSIYKYDGTRPDSLYTVRASHILIRPTDSSDSAKATARRRAESVLAQLRGGASFEAMAAQNSADGSAQQGGDLGYFKNNGQMVKPFEDAIFKFNGTGLLPSVVETDFGYHVIKVTEPKTNTLYRIVAINKTLGPSQATRDEAYRRAEQFASENRSLEAMEAAVKKQSGLVLLRAERIAENASSLNMIPNAREVVRWAFDEDTDAGETSPVFEVNDAYLVAVLTGATSEDEVKAADFRDELTAKVRNELKGEQIMKKLNTAGTLEQIAQKYGAGALVETASDITMANGLLNSAGADPVAIGKAFGQKPGTRTKPFVGETGVFIVEPTAKTPAPAIADYSLYRNQVQQGAAQRAQYYVNEAIKENANIKDYRAKFY
jgi:peptidyl-prolyl cis-trans isomerase D